MIDIARQMYAPVDMTKHSQRRVREEIMEHKIVINKCYGGFGLSDEALAMYNELTGTTLDWDYDIDRTDPNLIKVVETLGEKADGFCASLAIVSFKGNKYRIGEYDGMEWLETPYSIRWDTV